MATQTPIVLGPDVHRPLPAGDQLPGAAIQRSTDAGNSLALGGDGGLFVGGALPAAAKKFAYSASPAGVSGPADYVYDATPIVLTGLPDGGEVTFAHQTVVYCGTGSMYVGVVTQWIQFDYAEISTVTNVLGNNTSNAIPIGGIGTVGQFTNANGTSFYVVRLQAGKTQLTLKPQIALRNLLNGPVTLYIRGLINTLSIAK
jgi:hypothetical protein